MGLCPIGLLKGAFETLDQATEIFGEGLVFDGAEKSSELFAEAIFDGFLGGFVCES